MCPSRVRAALAAAYILVALPGVAHAQIWIGEMVGNMIAAGQAAQQERACMTGTPMEDKEVAEARNPALETMKAYFASARAGSAISGYFHLDKHTRWIIGATSVGMATLDPRDDPFARRGYLLDVAPLAFFRAGDGRSALGQWAVRNDAGAQTGTYTGYFTRAAGVWRLTTLELTPSSAFVEPIVQYCHKSGDVLPFRLQDTKYLRMSLEKKLASGREKVQKAQSGAAAARAKADARPQDASARAEADAAAERATRLSAGVAALESALADARAAEAQANAEARQAEERRAAAGSAVKGAG